MSGPDRLQLARDSYEAFASGDREAIEELLADDYTFSSPPDPDLDREGYFERCWPHAGRRSSFEYTRLIEAGDEVVVTYVSTNAEGRRFCNTEVLTFAGDKLRRSEVYFGWNLD
jgi:ketosteroid isomerase-like protein